MSSSRIPRRFAHTAPFPPSSESHYSGERSRPKENSKPEVILSSDDSAHRASCATARAAVRPRAIFVPASYESRYAYPLVIWLHDQGSSERDIARVLPQISTRNYLGLAVRGTTEAKDRGAGAFGWSRSVGDRLRLQEELRTSVRELRRDFHVHTERIYLAGAGAGGTTAWDLFLARPDWFAGLAVLGGGFPWRTRPLRHFRDLQGKRLFLTAANAIDGEVQQQRVARLMFSAGMHVQAEPLAKDRVNHRSVLRRIDRWIMESIGGCF